MGVSKRSATDEPTIGGSRLILAAAIFYFTSGFPFGLVNELLPIYLRQSGLGRGEIGVLLSTAGLAWTFKFLWSPLVDRFGSYVAWVASALTAISVALVVLTLTGLPTLVVLWLILSLIAFASATQDIALDGLSIVITPRGQLGRVNATRVGSYRVGMIVAGGGLAAAATSLGWNGAFAIAAAITLLLLAACSVLGRGATKNSSREERTLGEAVVAWIRRPSIIRVLAIVTLYKVGDAMIIPMIKLLWVDNGYSTREIGLATTIIGVGCTIVGAIVGGAVIERIGLFRSLIVLGALQASSNAAYAIAATLGANRTAMYTSSVVENFTSGLGTAAFLTFLMALCDRRFPASEFAMYSALYGFTRSFAGGFTGYVVDDIGYANFFWLSLVLSLPGLMMVLVSRRFISSLDADPSAVTAEA